MSEKFFGPELKKRLEEISYVVTVSTRLSPFSAKYVSGKDYEKQEIDFLVCAFAKEDLTMEQAVEDAIIISNKLGEEVENGKEIIIYVVACPALSFEEREIITVCGGAQSKDISDSHLSKLKSCFKKQKTAKIGESHI